MTWLDPCPHKKHLSSPQKWAGDVRADVPPIRGCAAAIRKVPQMVPSSFEVFGALFGSERLGVLALGKVDASESFLEEESLL